MTQLLANPRSPGDVRPVAASGAPYPYADQLLERVALGNKLIVVAVPNP